jgi:putative hydrolase
MEGNVIIPQRLKEAAGLLEEQGANPYRVGAYRRAAEALESLSEDARALFEREGLPGLMRLPGVGPQIASAILEMIRTGRWMFLERLRGTHNPEALFARVPGMGPKLAGQVIEQLHIDTLEALEAAAYDGRLEEARIWRAANGRHSSGADGDIESRTQARRSYG